MAVSVSDIDSVLRFLRSNGLADAESALRADVADLGCSDYEKFVFPMLPPPPPPVRIPPNSRRSGLAGAGEPRFESSSEDEFVSLGSSTSDFCSSEFTNPYGVRSASPGDSRCSSQFGTARDYHDFEMQNDLFLQTEKDEGRFLSPSFRGPDFFGCPSEDKFIMSLDVHNQCESLLDLNGDFGELREDVDVDYLEKACHFGVVPGSGESEVPLTDFYRFDPRDKLREVIEEDPGDCVVYDFTHGENLQKDNYLSTKRYALEDFGVNVSQAYDVAEKDSGLNGISQLGNCEVDEEIDELNDEILAYTNEDEFEVFELRIIHRKNRTGFEVSKDIPIVMNSVIAGRYYVTEYLGSAAFSRVVQARDLHTGVDVCLKIIKNDKDFFDQSLDEIKLLKHVNKHDPADERHILRLYDYFYHHEHLFIVCELLRANLYEFQKFSQESGREEYFTLKRLQIVTRQCLEALEFLHELGIIHCDLKPENILIKNYKRCEIKIIDLGSSCFRSDNLCLYVQSRSYRAPEVILGLPYDHKIDMWSLGCILAELCSGEVLFPNDKVAMILGRMIGMLGPIDLDMLAKGRESNKYFTEELDLYHINEETEEMEHIIPEEASLVDHLQVNDTGFVDFVSTLLEIDPECRPTAKQALQHPWLSQIYLQDSH